MSGLPAEFSENLIPGSLFEGKYRIINQLGTGSFAVVMHARHELMARDVALKFLKPSMTASNPKAVDRFVKEVQLISRLRHHNTVGVFDFGQTENGLVYMVMEYVEGETIEDVLQRDGAFSTQRAVQICSAILDSLHEAHTQNIVHRDLKPANIMLCKTENEIGQVKVLDFGVAKLLEPHDRESKPGKERQSTKFIGTPLYMSPEQILGEGITPASDIYSVGLVLYELLLGEAPLRAKNFAQVAALHLTEERLPFASINRLEGTLQTIIYKATERHAEKRYQSARQMADALHAYLNNAPMSITATATELSATVSVDATIDDTVVVLENDVDNDATVSSAAPSLPPSNQDVDDVFLGTGYSDFMSYGIEDDAPDEAVVGMSAMASPAVARPQARNDLTVSRPSIKAPPSIQLDDESVVIDYDALKKPKEDDTVSENSRLMQRPMSDRDLANIGGKETIVEKLVYGGASSALIVWSMYTIFLVSSAAFHDLSEYQRLGIGIIGPSLITVWTAYNTRLAYKYSFLRQWLYPLARNTVTFLLGFMVCMMLFGANAVATGLENDSLWFLSWLPEHPYVEKLEHITVYYADALASIFKGVDELIS